jgi:hypothetical protein
LWNGNALNGGSLAPEDTSLCWRQTPSIAMKLPAKETWIPPNQDGAAAALVGNATSAL